MSLDTLFQQIILTEQQISEKTRQFQEVKVAITRCEDKIKSCTENNRCVNNDLKEKVQQLTKIKLQYELMKKSQEEMDKQNKELLEQQSHLKEHLVKVRRESKEEKENFMKEIMSFNDDFSLLSDRKALWRSQRQSEVSDLEKEVSCLNQEMESINQSCSLVNSMREEQRGLHMELQGMEQVIRDLDSQLGKALTVTELLRAESLMVSQKPLSDDTCLRLKKELEMHKEEELELLREALSSEIHFLQSEIECEFKRE